MIRLLCIIFVFIISSTYILAIDGSSSSSKSSSFLNVNYSWLNDNEDTFIDLSYQETYSIHPIIFAYYELGASIGLDNKIAKYLIDFTPGLSIFILNKSNLFIKTDFGAGPAFLSPKEGDIQTGISSSLKVSLGYKFIGLFSELNFYQFKSNSFERFSVGLSFRL